MASKYQRPSIHDMWPKHGEIRELNERTPRTPFGARLRAFRKAKGYTQKLLGARADMAQQQVQALERGTRNPSMYTATRLSDALGVSPEDLLGPGLVATDPTPWLELRDAVVEAEQSLQRVSAIVDVLLGHHRDQQAEAPR